MNAAESRRAEARAIFDAALAAVDPEAAIRRSMSWDGAAGVLRVADRDFPLDRDARLVVVGGGKASARMARAFEHAMGDASERVTRGVVVVKYGHGVPLARVQVLEAGHPVPDEAGLSGASTLRACLEGLDERDLVVCLLSGGASALLPAPASGITLTHKIALTNALLRSGATIHETNIVRARMSTLKAGGLALAAAPARVVTLAISDVVGDDLAIIGSGPTFGDTSSFEEARATVRRLLRDADVPAAVRDRLAAGARGEVDEPPRPEDPRLSRVVHHIVASNREALEAAAARARELGRDPVTIPSDAVEGEAREVGASFGKQLLAVRRAARSGERVCILFGGETTVTVRGDGLGGRNQELALAASLEIAEHDGVTMLAAGTDGTDGPTDAAGAIVDAEILRRSAKPGLDPRAYLERNDSYRFFDALDALIRTGPTGTNVMDLTIGLVDG